jgi:hypothetical protein
MSVSMLSWQDLSFSESNDSDVQDSVYIYSLLSKLIDVSAQRGELEQEIGRLEVEAEQEEMEIVELVGDVPGGTSNIAIFDRTILDKTIRFEGRCRNTARLTRPKQSLPKSSHLKSFCPKWCCPKWSCPECHVVKTVFGNPDSEQDAPSTVWSETLQPRPA